MISVDYAMRKQPTTLYIFECAVLEIEIVIFGIN